MATARRTLAGVSPDLPKRPREGRRRPGGCSSSSSASSWARQRHREATGDAGAGEDGGPSHGSDEDGAPVHDFDHGGTRWFARARGSTTDIAQAAVEYEGEGYAGHGDDEARLSWLSTEGDLIEHGGWGILKRSSP